MKKITIGKQNYCQPMGKYNNNMLDNEERVSMKLVLSPGIIYQSKIWPEMNVMLSKVDVSHSGIITWGPRMGAEFNVIDNKFIVAPKIGYEFSGLPIYLRVSMVNYISNRKNDLRLLPEAGISFFGLTNLVYGYSVPIIKDQKMAIIPKHRIALTFNLSKDIWEEL